ncbi:MAG: glycosyltransferase [Acidimicrobiia bacterium]|nr:glycosyltransferase [Acidimicrobiia bacterium]
MHTMPDLDVGGGQVVALNAIREGDHESFDYDVLAVRTKPDDMVAEFDAAGVRPVVFDWNCTGRPKQVGELVKLFRARRVDLVHVHGLVERPAVLAAAFIARVPVVGHIHSEWVHLGPKFPPDASAVQRARARVLGWGRDALEHRVVRWYVADSTAAADLLRPYVRAPIDTMIQSMPAAEMARARAAHDDERWRAQLQLGPGPVAINVSRCVPGKGQDRLIRALASVRARVPDAQGTGGEQGCRDSNGTPQVVVPSGEGTHEAASL